jgi:adenosylmethionine-8-amino-7-oxononanoate aminotransferase
VDENKVFRVFLDDRQLPSVSSATGSSILVGKSKFLDTTAGGTSYAILGWNDPRVNDAVTTQLKKFGHIDYKIWNDPNLELLAKIILQNSPAELSKVYFAGNSGAEACEAAMKMSYQAHQINGNLGKRWFISRKQSYHGSTSDALMLGDRPNLDFYKPMLSPFRTNVSMHHYKKNSLVGETENDYADRCAVELEDKILEIGPENVAAFVGETIMGGLVGDVPPVGNYWKKIKLICEKYNVHLILDEVYCGTGTSGTYFCFEQDDVSPDFVFIGKTLAAGYGAISAVITTNTIYEIISSSTDKRLQHTTTHQAHSLSVAAALKIQQIVSDEHFLEEVRKKGEYFRMLLADGLEKYDFIIDIRGRGLRFSVEHSIKNQEDFGKKFEEVAKNDHNILFNAKWHRICLTPPLIIENEEIEFAAQAAISTFKLLAKDFA